MTSVSESLQISLDNHPLPKKRKKKPGLAKQGSQQGLILAPGDTGPQLGTSVVVTIGGAPGIVWVGAGNAAQPSTVPRWSRISTAVRRTLDWTNKPESEGLGTLAEHRVPHRVFLYISSHFMLRELQERASPLIDRKAQGSPKIVDVREAVLISPGTLRQGYNRTPPPQGSWAGAGSHVFSSHAQMGNEG